uniref:ATP-dependent Clp protease proteolytic subunit n=1 Tax=Corsia dispar TaxID=1678084 RepID=A0A7D3Q5S4_9LILI|nr:clpP-like protease [Corsia dispar]QKE31462.1 clpP-like protease [Corsia dispar]
MPFGVPKVPFKGRREKQASWVELYNRLYRERILFIGEEIDLELSGKIVSLMVHFSIEDKTREFFLFINSPGGSIMAGMGIYDMMQYIAPDVNTICLGLAASMGSVILVGGEITKRVALPHARIMIHQPLCASSEESADEFIRDAGELAILREMITDIYVQRTGTPFCVVSKDINIDNFMSATEAQAHGIIDSIGLGDENIGHFFAEEEIDDSISNDN